MQVIASIADKKIKVEFEFDWTAVQKVKTVSGARFVPPEKGGPHWTVPLDLTSARMLQKTFDKELKLSKELKDWGRTKVDEERNLASLAVAETATLARLPAVLPDLYTAIHVGPVGRFMTGPQVYAAMNKPASFQAADVAFLAAGPNQINGNQPGLGKTLETIAAIFEAGTENGKQLVIAPLTSLESVWQVELEAWQPYPVFVATGTPTERERAIQACLKVSGPAWLVVNPAMVQYRRVKGEHVSDDICLPRYPKIQEQVWNNIVLDECHKAGLRSLKTLTAMGLLKLQAEHKRFALSGTPIGGKVINLWPVLHYLNPKEFSSKWRWADQWLVIEEGKWGKNIGGLRPDRIEEFYKSLTPYLLRRLKSEVISWLPPKQFMDVWCEMSPKQAKQYKTFAAAAEVRIEETDITATSILAEYTRLKQFAISLSSVRELPDGTAKVIPTEDSCKLEALEEILDERGILEGDGDEQVVIFSQFSEVVDMVYAWLEKKKVNVAKLTGATNKKGQRAGIQKDFQDKNCRVLVMTTTAGGVAITLDAADTVVFMDTTWVPDDQEQAEDRVHRASRIHQVTCYYLRTKNTIEEYIFKLLSDKQNVNEMILDLRRKGLRAV